MPVQLAYLSVILIWATTPLAIQWSTQGAGFAFAVFSRMLIGVLVGAGVLAMCRIPFPLHAHARRVYLVGGASLFAGMALTYWAARHVHSGLISVMFGLSPLAAAVMAALWLGERSLTRRRIAGAVLGVGGLAVIFVQGGLAGGPMAVAGLLALLVAMTCYTAGMVWIKRIGNDSPPLATTVGTVAVALPGFALVWWLAEGRVPVDLPLRALSAIVYLGVFGSVIGFAAYYHCIRHLEASRVALITLITPVLALLLGQALNGEHTTPRLWTGVVMILCGLVLHQWEVFVRRARPG
ncbi:EamA family transporter [Nitrogeniibacter mangrovi]|uniref:EamA family transporter n=1 Tax=Nitrogeniibacter mangrovi TaxID=2016596 RepID=A0A6C1BAX4_9RHOO|nr:EamA family transporter [Nitrogeniibacter mangrovi]QID19550.1 EamA family transporter [Nitrogeniibacter mangrovi]